MNVLAVAAGMLSTGVCTDAKAARQERSNEAALMNSRDVIPSCDGYALGSGVLTKTCKVELILLGPKKRSEKRWTTTPNVCASTA